MTWPSPSLPLITSQTNATVQLDNHPADHATTNLVINDDVAPQITQNIANIATNTANITNTTDTLTTHRVRNRDPYTLTVAQPLATGSAKQWTCSTQMFVQRRHGVTFGVINTLLSGTSGATGGNLQTYVSYPGGAADTTYIESQEPVGFGTFDDGTGGYEAVYLLHSPTENMARLVKQKDATDTWDAIVPQNARLRIFFQYFCALPDTTD